MDSYRRQLRAKLSFVLVVSVVGVVVILALVRGGAQPQGPSTWDELVHWIRSPPDPGFWASVYVLTMCFLAAPTVFWLYTVDRQRQNWKPKTAFPLAFGLAGVAMFLIGLGFVAAFPMVGRLVGPYPYTAVYLTTNGYQAGTLMMVMSAVLVLAGIIMRAVESVVPHRRETE